MQLVLEFGKFRIIGFYIMFNDLACFHYFTFVFLEGFRLGICRGLTSIFFNFTLVLCFLNPPIPADPTQSTT